MYKICQKQSSSHWECRGQNLITTNPITWFLEKEFFSWSLLKSHKFWCCSWLMESYRSAQRIWVIEERISPKSEAIFEKFKNCQFSSIANLRLGFGNWELVSAGKSFNSKIFPHVIPLLNSQNYGVKWEAILNMFLKSNCLKRPLHDVLACTCLMKTI